MAPSESEMREMGRRLLLARMRLLSEHGFYGLLLMHMRFAIGDELDTAWVSSDTITFNPEFMGRLSDEELDFVLEHEVLHAALGHVSRGLGYEDPELFNVACDIVVNSNILYSNDMDHRSITLSEFGESMHRTPSGDEGYDYTAEEVYDMLLDRGMASGGAPGMDSPEPSDVPRGSRAARGRGNPHSHSARDTESGVLDEVRRRGRGGRWDWHVPSDGAADGEARGKWVQRLRDAREAMRARDPFGKRGLVPLGVERLLGELDEPRADWRLLLNDFVLEEVCDWSWSIPDRRVSESPFLLPSYSDTETAVRNILFMVDTSGSVSDRELASVFGEIAGAIEQFAGKMDGWLGFFDAVPYKPVRFETVKALADIRPRGGGGTRFKAVFECVDRWLEPEELSCIVILTDGFAPFPDETIASGIPVLWLIDGDGPAPEWGKVARINRR